MSREVRLGYERLKGLREADGHDEPARLDRFLASRFPKISRTEFARLIESGGVRIDGRRARKGHVLRTGEEIAFAMPDPRRLWRIVPDPDAPLHVWHEDGAIVCVEKPAGSPCLPLRPDERGTMANALVARYAELDEIGGPLEAGLLHRLDTGTSGLLVAARTADAYDRLRTDWRKGRVEKIYLAVVRGEVRAAGRIAAPLAQHAKSERRMIIASSAAEPGALSAHTEYEPVRIAKTRTADSGVAESGTVESRTVERGTETRTLLLVRIREGRRHQIRVHLESIGHPVVGDALYAGRAGENAPPPPAARLALHSHRMRFNHPTTGEPLALESPLPADLEALL